MLIKKQDLLKRILVSGFLTGTLLCAVLLLGEYVPFGSGSLVTMDAKIQYLDFFCFLKDVINGDNSVIYSFSKMLGGSYFAVFSYYLTSPFNFLVIFFDKNNFIFFFHLLIVLKLVTSSITFTVFLYYRFGERLGKSFSVLLSVGYALAQYNLAQSSNIMWLDGVYLLPLILLGVYMLVKERCIGLLAVTVAFSLIFNWYTGCINCLFSALWLFYEILLGRRKNIKEFFVAVGQYAVSMLLGILMSCILFLPSVLSLLSGRGSANWELLNAGLVGSPLTVLSNYELGGLSDAQSVSFYVGVLAVLGFLMFFLSKNIKLKDKVVTAVFSVIGIALYYWVPLYFLFSLLKSVTSYWSRYSYLGCFFILFVSAFYFAACREERSISTVIKAVVIFVVAKILGDMLYKNGTGEWGIITLILFLAVSTCIFALIKLGNRTRVRRMFIGLMAIIVLADMGINTGLVFSNYSDVDGEIYSEYVSAEEELITEIKNRDKSDYRISDLYPRNVDKQRNLRANYNEAAAYNFWSVSGYDSDPDEIQRSFLDSVGYRINGENLCVVNTSILPVDSLLGVKYILSDQKISGLEKVTEIERTNQKETYENPYALPMAFVYEKYKDMEGDSAESVFEYTNRLYSQLLGEQTEVFKKVDFQCNKNDNQIEYQLETPSESSISVYGNITWNYEVNGKLYVNDEFVTDYSKWLSPGVFYAGGGDESEITVRLDTEYSTEGVRNAEFYYVDLDTFSQIAKSLSSREVSNLSMENGKIFCETEGKKGEYLFLSVPYDEGWDITVNGKTVEPELLGECLMTLPLEEGENQIEMTYGVKGLEAGIALSVAGVATLALILVWKRKKTRKPV